MHSPNNFKHFKMEPATQANQEYVPEASGISKEQHQAVFQRGLRWLGVGVFLMAISFAVNFLLFQSEQSFHVPMYVMTSAGLICIVKSMADILGF